MLHRRGVGGRQSLSGGVGAIGEERKEREKGRGKQKKERKRKKIRKEMEIGKIKRK